MEPELYEISLQAKEPDPWQPDGTGILPGGDGVSTSLVADDRDYPDGNSNDARLMRWLVDQRTDPRIRSEGSEPVTLTGGELFDLLYDVTDWAYHNGTSDVHASVQQRTGLDLYEL